MKHLNEFIIQEESYEKSIDNINRSIDWIMRLAHNNDKGYSVQNIIKDILDTITDGKQDTEALDIIKEYIK